MLSDDDGLALAAEKNGKSIGFAWGRVTHRKRERAMETLINEEALLLVKFLRNEGKTWIQRAVREL